MCEQVKPRTAHQAALVLPLCPQNPVAIAVAYRESLVASAGVRAKSERIDMQRTQTLSAPLAWSAVLPLLEAIESARDEPSPGGFRTATRDALLEEFGLQAAELDADTPGLGALMLRAPSVSVMDAHAFDTEFYHAVHLVFAHASGIDALATAAEQDRRFPRRATPPIDNWRALFYVLQRYYARSLPAATAEVADHLLAADVPWHAVPYLGAGDVPPGIVAWQVAIKALTEMRHNVTAAYRVDVLRRVLQRAGTLIPEETVAPLVLPDLVRVSSIATDRRLEQAYLWFVSYATGAGIRREVLADERGGPRTRLLTNVRAIESLISEHFRRTNVLALVVLRTPASVALRELKSFAATESDDPEPVLQRYTTDVRDGISGLLRALPDKERPRAAPTTVEDVVYDSEFKDLWTAQRKYVKRELPKIELFTGVNRDDYLTEPRNVRDFNGRYLRLARYAEAAYFQLTTRDDLSEAITQSLASDRAAVVLFVWSRSRLLGALSTLNMFVMTWNGRIAPGEEPNTWTIVNLSENFRFPTSRSTIEEEPSVRRLYRVPDRKKTTYVTFERAFGTGRSSTPDVLFFGLWFAELALRAFDAGHIEKLRDVIGSASDLNNFVRGDYIPAVQSEAQARATA
ncbi:hypothetical protein LCGC14_1593350 [marine sediment metagenome]|uniref:Uncharacterized protein n=1 Tax=marine sediment metagenome TaxID=412755 RepID=A0A0F9KU30_9ZZZZ